MKKTISILALLLTVALSCSSCSSLLRYQTTKTEEHTQQTETSDQESAVREESVTETTIDQTVNNITITGGSTDVAYAAASGLRSIVSVYASSRNASGAGSGVILRLDGETGSAFVITNYHVVYMSGSYFQKGGICDEIFLFLYGMESDAYAIPATFVGGSASYDIAVLYVENSDLLKNAYASGSAAAANIADSDLLTPGETAIAIGNPEASGISVTTGIVSVDSEYITMTASDYSGEVELRVIRIDTAVNSGNSGGGLFDAEGKLIGIVNAKISASDVENIGYAIPSNVACAIADNIIDYCFETDCVTVMRGIMGVTVGVSALSTAFDSETGRFERIEEVYIHEVVSGGLAEGNLQAGDIVLSIAVGDKVKAVTRQHHLIDAMLNVRVGDTVTTTVLRDGKEIAISTVITEDCLTAY
ncbi:MAG: trypsin-like peptidase domain-containing protein [Clostridia bacterium]|nr:trypsin-like peptidase domain-containing protein [Clostridia bacterium]